MSEEKSIVPTVWQDGKQISPKADYDEFMAFLMQASANAQLVKLRKLEESKVPIGDRSFSLTITDETTELWLDPPWISFALVNDSEDYGVQYAVNSEARFIYETYVRPRETLKVDMKYSIIRVIYLKTEDGGSAAIRLFGVEGKR
jgi:hypothetical protein